MYIPKTMSKAIAENFYDKTISKLVKNIITDEEGGVVSKGYNTISDFKGNASFSNCKEIQEQYGLDYEIDISITTSVDTEIEIDDIIKYNNITFKVTDVLVSDSHKLVVATKWQ